MDGRQGPRPVGFRHAPVTGTPTSCGGHVMSIAKVIEISSQSPKGIEEAIRDGLRRASKTINNIKGAWVNEIKVVTDDSGKVTDWRVNMRINFVLD
jgi:flavin-binding protein dodecin